MGALPEGAKLVVMEGSQAEPEGTVEQEKLVATPAATVALVVVGAKKVEEVLAAEVLVALQPEAGDRMSLSQIPEARRPLRLCWSTTPFVGRVLHQLSFPSVVITNIRSCCTAMTYSQTACSLRWNRPPLSAPKLLPIRTPVKRIFEHADGVVVSGRRLDSSA